MTVTKKKVNKVRLEDKCFFLGLTSLLIVNVVCIELMQQLIPLLTVRTEQSEAEQPMKDECSLFERPMITDTVSGVTIASNCW